ncbi:MAG: hypothetical protein ACT4ON_04430 [Bacteroidota bacterium]
MANAHIVSFIQSLNDHETRTAEDHILKVLSACKTNSAESKQLILFRYITANKEKNISEAVLIKSTGTKNIASLKLRLYETVTEALTLDSNIYNKNVFEERDQIQFKLKKKLLLLRILHRSLNQKRTLTLDHLSNEIIREAKIYDFYEILVEVLTFKKYRKGIRSGIKEFDEINKEVIFYDQCQKAVNYSADCYYRLILNNDFVKSLTEKELGKHFQLSIQRMETDYKKTGSHQVNFYLHILYFALFERKKNYIKAIEYCNKLIALLNKKKAIYYSERIGFILDNLSQFKTYMGNYESAAMDAKKAQQYYIEKSFSYFISKKQELYANLYGNNWKQAFKCIEELSNQSLVDSGEFRASKYVYFQACALFIANKYKEALELLKTPLEIEKDKTRWNVSLRILNIMLFIELNKNDEAERSLESLRKYMERAAKSDEISPRDVLIVKTLRELEKDNFEFRSKNTAVTKMLDELSAKDTPLSWEHYTSELIPFHKWLEGKKK